MSSRGESNKHQAQILVVDDSAASLKLLTTLLTNHGYQVRPASSGHLALRSAAVETPDLILLDVRMPDMDGYEVCRHLKADEQTRNVPLIFISGLDEVVDKVKGFEAGCVDYITKPFEPQDILARIETHLHLRSLQKQLEERNRQLQEEIVERVRAESLLQEKEARYQAIVEAFDGYIYICSQDFHIEFMNERFKERTGYDGTGSLCYKALHDRDAICPWCVNDRVFQGETVRWEVLSPKDNHWLYVVNTPIYHSDGSISKQSMILDITDRKRMEEELQQAHDDLERQVAARTEELARTNTHLQAEVAERKRAERDLRKLNRTLKMLSECNQTVVRTKDEKALLHDICRIIVEMGSYEMAWVGFAEQDEEKSVRPAACAGREEGYLKTVRMTWGNPVHGWDPIGTAIRTGEAIVCENMATDQVISSWCVQAARHNYQSSMVIPLAADGQVLGVLGIYGSEPGAFDPEEVNLLTELAGDLAYGIVTLRARDERKQAEEERVHLVTAIEQSAEGIITTDMNWIIQYANPAFEKLTGYSKNEIIGQHTRVLKSDKHDRAFYERIRETLARGEVWSGRLTSRRKDGTFYEVEATASPVRDISGAIINYVGVHRDITQEVKLERELRQAQKMEAMGTLAGGIAHDFNNILAAIVGYSEMAHSRVPPGSPAHRNLEQVLKASHRATDLVKQILAFSRQREQERKPLRIGPIVKEALKLLRSTLPTTIEIRQYLAVDAAECTVLADPTQIHQVLMNLCTNAAHAMRARGGILEVSITEIEVKADLVFRYLEMKPGHYVKLAVSDTGPGMDAAVMERIFEPYFTTKGPGEGTGLGLSVVQGIVKDHGGEIRVQSEPGVGTTFEVLLPRIDEELAPGTEVVAVLPTGSERILFVDDEEIMVDLGKEMLGFLGYRVSTSTSSFEALETFRAEPDAFDLVITDMTMPGLTGSSLARELMAIRRDIPIILCTGFSELINEKEAKKAGIREFVMKPYVATSIAGTIRRVLDAK